MKVHFKPGHHLKFIKKELEADMGSRISGHEKEGVIGILESNKIIRSRKRTHLLNTTILAGQGEVTCKRNEFLEFRSGMSL